MEVGRQQTLLANLDLFLFGLAYSSTEWYVYTLRYTTLNTINNFRVVWMRINASPDKKTTNKTISHLLETNFARVFGPCGRNKNRPEKVTTKVFEDRLRTKDFILPMIRISCRGNFARKFCL